MLLSAYTGFLLLDILRQIFLQNSQAAICNVKWFRIEQEHLQCEHSLGDRGEICVCSPSLPLLAAVHSVTTAAAAAAAADLSSGQACVIVLFLSDTDGAC